MLVSEKLISELVLKGLDREWLADMVHRHGPDVLALVEKALVLGLSAEITREALTLVGRIGFEIMVKVLDIKMLFRGDGAPVLSEDVNTVVADVLKKYK